MALQPGHIFGRRFLFLESAVDESESESPESESESEYESESESSSPEPEESDESELDPEGQQPPRLEEVATGIASGNTAFEDDVLSIRRTCMNLSLTPASAASSCSPSSARLK